MDETRFSSLMRQAIGDETMHPWLTSAVRARIVEPPARPAANRVPLLVAAALVALVTAAAWFAPQFASRRTNQTTVPAASPSPSPVAVDPAGCRLPVLLVHGQAGFIDTSYAGFIPDASAPSGAVSYSPPAGQWVGVPYANVSPDGREYAWLNGRELHVRQITIGRDTTLLTFGVNVYIWRWEQSGIRVGEQPFSPFLSRGSTTWLVDPKTGSASQETTAGTGLPFYPPGVPGTRFAFRPLGTDADGHVIWWFHNLDLPEGVDLIFVERSPTDVTYIRKGSPNDGFIPQQAFGDATGVWFLDSAHNAIWHWQPGGELAKIQPPPRAAMLVVATIAGPCF